MSRGTLITLTYTPFRIKSFKGNPLSLYKENFSGFSTEPFPGAITTAATISIAIITAITTAITPPVIITTATTAINGTPTRVKALPFKEIFQKVNLNTSL